MLQQQLKGINARTGDDNIDWNDTEAISKHGHTTGFGGGNLSSKNETNTAGKRVMSDFFEDETLNPRSTTQGKTLTLDNG